MKCLGGHYPFSQIRMNSIDQCRLRKLFGVNVYRNIGHLWVPRVLRIPRVNYDLEAGLLMALLYPTDII